MTTADRPVRTLGDAVSRLDLKCRKRDGRDVPFDPAKVSRAVSLCFAAVPPPAPDPARLVEEITWSVVNTVVGSKVDRPGVEDVQRYVIQQLWARGLFDQAEHYQNYREARRRARLDAPIDDAVRARFGDMKRHFPTDLQVYQFVSKFSRWDDSKRRRETWAETCRDRVLPWLFARPGCGLTDAEKSELSASMYDLEASPAMRVVQMAGPALDRCEIGAFNCSALPLSDPFAFSELLYILMQGTGVGFSVEGEHVDRLPPVKRQNGKAETVVVDDSTEGWCSSYRRHLELLWDGWDTHVDVSRVRPKGARLRTKGGRACLTADTVVYKDKKGSTAKDTLTIGELYEKRVRTPRRLRLIKIRCLDEATGTFQRNRIVDVIDNGVADVYEVATENGYRIKATLNHRFMDQSRSYRHLESFAPGDLIGVNGAVARAGSCEECGAVTHRRSTRCKACFTARPVCLSCGDGLKHRASRCLTCRERTGRCVDCGCSIGRRKTRCRPCADRVQIKPDALPTTARARKECQSHNSGVCSLCGRDDVDTQVHHKDRNPLNNRSENLLCLCEPCHRKLHAAEDTFGNPYSHRYLSFDRIVSITKVGRERVYDLAMAAPNHNFVANGFVSHNSGPGPYLELIAFSRNVFKSRAGKRLTDLDAHDVACMSGKIVEVGGVRRAAMISLSDLDSRGMRDAKSGAWYDAHRQRTASNNSAVYEFEGRPPVDVFMEEWLALVKSKSGERGIFNRHAARKHRPARRADHSFITNPCAEIILRMFGLCNLSIAVARPHDTEASLVRKVRAAAYFGKIQSLCTRFNYVRPDWARNAEEERLMGVDVTGHADCPLLARPTPERASLLRRLKAVVDEVDVTLSRRWGIPRSAANTCVKPSGDSAVFFDCASGVSPRFAAHQVRWVRESKDSPVAKFLMDSGVPWAPAPESPDALLVFGFPKAAPAGCVLRDHVTALDQLENWLQWKTEWAEHSVSATIYVADHEWMAVGAWVYEHFDEISGLSFLPKDNGTYSYAPNEEVTEAQYRDMVARFPDLDWAKITRYEDDDNTMSRQVFACVGGDCG